MYQKGFRSLTRSFVIVAAAALLTSIPGQAADGKSDFAGYTKYLSYRAHYDINRDGTHVETVSWAIKVLSQQGVAIAQKAPVSFSDSLEKMDVTTAYTLKKDGRKIEVPATNYQDETNTGKGTATPMFSDIRTKTVAFPDVDVGDTVVFEYKLTQHEATFPGNFSMLQSFSKFQVYDDAQVSLSAPATLGLRVYSRGVEGGEAPSSDGHRNWAWSYKNQKVATPEPASVSPLDYGPLIVATTFKDYAALAEAYNARASTKATQTDAIKKLANELTQNLHTPRDMAKALYDWVSQNIKYAGNGVGIGSVVPHDADVVLANRMGDCKDHTTLLQALLAVKGIASVPSLINAGDAYKLSDVPCIEMFNHVISYIPSLGLYADSTSEFTQFGSLPRGDQGKPVVQTIDFKGIQHTPTPTWKDNGSSSVTVMKINLDGSAEGETTIQSKGESADSWRYGMTYLQPNMEEEWVRRAISAQGFTGTGTLIKGDVTVRSDSYMHGSKFKVSDAMNLPGPGAMYIRSPFDGVGGISQFIEDTAAPDPTVDSMCYGAYARQKITIILPKGIRVLAMPKNVVVQWKNQTYKATYENKHGTVTAVREVEDRTSGPVCGPDVSADYKKFSVGLKKDLRAQMLYE